MISSSAGVASGGVIRPVTVRHLVTSEGGGGGSTCLHLLASPPSRAVVLPAFEPNFGPLNKVLPGPPHPIQMGPPHSPYPSPGPAAAHTATPHSSMNLIRGPRPGYCPARHSCVCASVLLMHACHLPWCILMHHRSTTMAHSGSSTFSATPCMVG